MKPVPSFCPYEPEIDEIPQIINEGVYNRFMRLPPEAQNTLSLLAIYGSPITVPELFRLLNLTKLEPRPVDIADLQAYCSLCVELEQALFIGNRMTIPTWVYLPIKSLKDAKLLNTVVTLLIKDSVEHPPENTLSNIERHLWWTIWNNPYTVVLDHLKSYETHILKNWKEHVFFRWFDNPGFAVWFDEPLFYGRTILSNDTLYVILSRLTQKETIGLRPNYKVLAVYAAITTPPPFQLKDWFFHFILVRDALFEKNLGPYQEEGPCAHWFAARHYREGDAKAALTRYQAARKTTGAPWPWLLCLQYLSLLLQKPHPDWKDEALSFVAEMPQRLGADQPELCDYLRALIAHRENPNNPPPQLDLDGEPWPGVFQPLQTLVVALHCAWFNVPDASQWFIMAMKSLTSLGAMAHEVARAAYQWMLRNQMDPALVKVIETFDKKNASAKKGLALVNAFPQVAAWLEQFHLLEGLDIQSDTLHQEKRLIWMITLTPFFALQPFEQIYGARGWQKPRAISLRQLSKTYQFLTYLTPQDLQLITNIKDGRGTHAHIPPEIVARYLPGHPLLFLEDLKTPAEMARATPSLQVERVNDEISVRFHPHHPGMDSCLFECESPTRILVYEFTKTQRRMAELLRKPLLIPANEKERAKALINKMSGGIPVHSELEDKVSASEQHESSNQVYVLLTPRGQGLNIKVRVQPLPNGSWMEPGEGGTTLMTVINHKRLQVTRNKAEEVRLAEMVIQVISQFAEVIDLWEWEVASPLESLMLVEQLATPIDHVVISWPEGESFQVKPIVSKQIRISVRRKNDWFELQGKIQVSEHEVYELHQLLKLAAKHKGRFVPLSDGTHLALSLRFRRLLDQINASVDLSSKQVRVHPMATLALDLDGQADNIEYDDSWTQLRQRIEGSLQQVIELPANLVAEPRTYQVEGYKWLRRLADWGAGACLADDMGLGKTLQALMLISSRAQEGPSLVIAPTSVTSSWVEEAQRFAPNLRPTQLSGDRQRQVQELGPYDVLVTSYGLLQTETELLGSVTWRTLVLDEAQAIKNAETKRAKAARTLKADFRMALTGTPIENSLSEIWSLFEFLNPGLLGSANAFHVRFSGAETLADEHQRLALRKLIHPFILRRLKNQVLDELPEKTEIVLHVDLSPKEQSMYEALRKEGVTLADEPSQSGQQFKVLALITKLRRCCCNPKLLLPDSNLPSSKLEALGELLDELLANNHKALIFSQFVDHLSLIRAFIEARGISYQYLDGSTPAAERATRIKAFQAGQGALFLISLKAGGTGLNLTAADYVIHMDPWWNPAVEDQASDRAHRIGQQRPVTVYRFITRNTIEEKILSLHRDKRDLADSLLEGGDMAARLTASDLLKLIKDH